jgi:hypothetical protein
VSDPHIDAPAAQVCRGLAVPTSNESLRAACGTCSTPLVDGSPVQAVVSRDGPTEWLQVKRLVCPGCRIALPRTLGVVALVLEASLGVFQQASHQSQELVLGDVSVVKLSPAGESDWAAGSWRCRCVAGGDDRR